MYLKNTKKILTAILGLPVVLFGYNNCSGSFQANQIASESLPQGNEQQDTTAPIIVIQSDIAEVTQSKILDISFSVQSISPVSSLKCDVSSSQLSSNPIDCSSMRFMKVISTDGDYSLSITALLTNGKSSTLNRNFRIDSTPPVIQIVSNPPNPTSSLTHQIEFTSIDALSGVRSVECSIDSTPFESCSSPWSKTLTTGSHQFQIQSTDLAGNTSKSNLISWTIDATAPSISILTKPNPFTNSTSASFTFTSTGSSSVECAVDGGNLTACTSPFNINNLSSNSKHTFLVRARSAAGITSDASFSWTIDTLAPSEPVITSSTSQITNLKTIIFNFSASDTNNVSSFSCSLNSSPFSACTSPFTGNSQEGPNNLIVRATDSAGNTTQSQPYSWTVDSILPSVTITASPPVSTTSSTASFTYSAQDNGSGISVVKCALDAATPSDCPSTTNAQFQNLAIGAHSFKIQAVDRANNSTQTTFNWTIIAPDGGGGNQNPPTPAGGHLGLKACEPGTGKDYLVGPTGNLNSLDLVPWETLSAGDTVRIQYQSSSYKSKILLGRSGTASAPIRVCGIRGPNGERPIIDGNGATTRSTIGISTGAQQKGLILIQNAGNNTPKFIQIDGLSIRSAHSMYNYKNSSGASAAYADFSACIYMIQGQNITIADNEISDCGQAIFSSSVDGSEANITRNLRIAGNTFSNNGMSGDALKHTLYIQTMGVIYEFNRFAAMRSGSPGNAIKDRSAGVIIRYNRIESGTRSMDLVDAEEHKETAKADNTYLSTYVYGNQIIKSGREVVHYGGDHPGSEPYYRKGTLYFFNNTVVASGGAKLFQISTLDESVQAWNNIFYFSNGTPLLREVDGYVSGPQSGGTLTLGKNWINSGFKDSNTTLGRAVIGTANLITGSSAPMNITTLIPSDTSLVDSGQENPTGALNYSVQYQMDVANAFSVKARLINGTAIDIGAVEK